MTLVEFPWRHLIDLAQVAFVLFSIAVLAWSFWYYLNATCWKLLLIILLAPFHLLGVLIALIVFGFHCGDTTINAFVEWINRKEDRYKP